MLFACNGTAKPVSPTKKVNEFSIFATADLRGTTEPCGCNSDPLGDIARLGRLIKNTKDTRKTLWIDGGSMLFSDTQIADRQKPAQLAKAELIQQVVKDIGLDAVGIGDFDLSLGSEKVIMPRLAANLSGLDIPMEKNKIVVVGDHRIGIFGVVTKNFSHGVVQDPIAAAKTTVSSLKKNNKTTRTIALLHMPRREALALVKKVQGIDIALVGQEAPEPDNISQKAQRVGDTWIIQPANRGQVVTRMDIRLQGDGPLVDAIGPAVADYQIKTLQTEQKELQQKLKQWQAMADADPQYISNKQKELAEIGVQIQSLKDQPTNPPKQGSWFVHSQVRIKKSLPCLADIVAKKKEQTKIAGQLNRKNADPTPPDKTGQHYVGIESCANCHSEAVDFWKTTKHAAAWQTLQTSNKQYDYECTGCHVTGWQKKGGSTMGFHDELTNVQCEVCHGPGSKHASTGDEGAIVLSPEKTVCAGCHNAEHSDTFDFVPYLRDVTGEGHGEDFRKKLGDGPTGLALRTAALKKAGLTIGDGCPK